MAKQFSFAGLSSLSVRRSNLLQRHGKTNENWEARTAIQQIGRAVLDLGDSTHYSGDRRNGCLPWTKAVKPF